MSSRTHFSRIIGPVLVTLIALGCTQSQLSETLSNSIDLGVDVTVAVSVNSSLDSGMDATAVPLSVCEMSDLDGPILFLCSDGANYITGAALDINGGQY